jgi:hypothetical protein
MPSYPEENGHVPEGGDSEQDLLLLCTNSCNPLEVVWS